MLAHLEQTSAASGAAGPSSAGLGAAGLSAPIALELARRALANVVREYPNHPQYLLEHDADLRAPRSAHPAFFGCFDWHSAVHTHWLLVRLLNAVPSLAVRGEIEAALSRSLAAHPLRVEADYLERHPAFERPYGLAWLALLEAETVRCSAPAARAWERAVERAAGLARENLRLWLARLHRPVRSGAHAQTAFALTLLDDAARLRGDAALLAAVRAAALWFYRDDVDAPLAYEPSGEDFLSPCLMEADLMRRVLEPDAFARWLRAFLPRLPTSTVADWLPCGEVADETDGKLVHLHGLNLSRAWNLANIAAALPPNDDRVAALRAAAERHAEAGVSAALAATDYAGSHWLPTFAVYLLTR